MKGTAQHLRSSIQHVEHCCWWGAQALISVLLLGTIAAASAGPAAVATNLPIPVLLSCCSWTEEHHRLGQRKLTCFLEFYKPEKQNRQYTNCEQEAFKVGLMNALPATAYRACVWSAADSFPALREVKSEQHGQGARVLG